MPLTLGRIPEGVLPTFPTDGFYNLLVERALTPIRAKVHFDEYLCELADQSDTVTRIQDHIEALSLWLPSWLNSDMSLEMKNVQFFKRRLKTSISFYRSVVT